MSLFSTVNGLRDAFARAEIYKAEGVSRGTGPIDTSHGSRLQDEIRHANARLHRYKREGGDVDLHTLAVSGARVLMKADTAPVPPALKLLWFRLEYPQLAMSDEVEAQAMADRLFATLSEKEQARFVAMTPDIGLPNNSGDLVNPKQPPLRQVRDNFSQAYETARGVLAEMLPGGAYKRDTDSPELDTAMGTVDSWVDRRAQLRQKSEQTRTTTVTKTDSGAFDRSLARMAAGFRQKSDGKTEVFKMDNSGGIDLEHLFK